MINDNLFMIITFHSAEKFSFSFLFLHFHVNRKSIVGARGT